MQSKSLNLSDMFGSTTMEEPLLPTKSKSWAIFGFFGGVAATLSILAVVVVLLMHSGSHVQSSTMGTVALAGEYGPSEVAESGRQADTLKAAS